MIDHIIHFYNKEFTYSWNLKIPFRLNIHDRISNELLEHMGTIRYNKLSSDEWMDFCCENEDFEVEYIKIDHNACVVAWLIIPKE